jgi:hypothetical protein
MLYQAGMTVRVGGLLMFSAALGMAAYSSA